MRKGQKVSEKTRRRMSLAKKGNKNPAKRLEVRKKMSEAKKGKYIGNKNPNWKGGFWIGKNGIKWIRNKNGKEVAEYRLKIEKIIGRSLKANEIVHHIDGNRSNDTNSNLLACDRAYHLFLHRRENPNSYKSGTFQLKEEKEKRAKSLWKPVLVNNVKYNSMKEAVQKSRISSDTIRRKIKINTKGFRYLKKEINYEN